jgi:hypothetical protein
MPDDIQPPTQPVKETPEETVPTVAKTTTHNNPGVLVLQWLTYAFWGWTVLALAWLTAMSVGFFLNPDSTENYESTTVAYSLAAVIVLYLISVICDAFYARVEPRDKTGGSMVIMIIHAVIFALFGIGSLIFAVFAIVRLLIGDGSSTSYGDDGAITMLITSLIITLVYGATLLRALRPLKLKRSSMIYGIFMGIVTAVIVILAISGPAYSARMTRDDRLIERTLPELSEEINSYTNEKNALPTSLTELSDKVSEDTKTLIDRNLVEYTPKSKIAASASDLPLNLTQKPILAPDTGDIFQYQLCVTYKAAKGSGSYDSPRSEYGTTTPDTYQHDAGRVCYDLQTNYRY